VFGLAHRRGTRPFAPFPALFFLSVAIFVDAGQKVRKGEPIGIEGNSGGAGAKHIHFSVHRGKALEGGPSVPFTSLATGTGVQSSESLRCGFWPTDGKPITQTAHVSTAPKVTPTPTYRVRAKLVEPPVPLGSPPVLVCPKGFIAVDGEACLALPRDGKASKILLYFHEKIPEAEPFESSWEFGGVARYATERGFAVLAMRGERGLCNWNEEVRHAWCWPTSIEPVAESVEGNHARNSFEFDIEGPIRARLLQRRFLRLPTGLRLQAGVLSLRHRAGRRRFRAPGRGSSLNAGARPSSTKRCLVRKTVEVLVDTVSAMTSAVAPALAASRIWARLSFLTGPLPPLTRRSSSVRSSGDNVTR